MKPKAKITAKDFIKIVEWSDEDRCYIGSAPPLIGQCCHGDDETKVMKELAQIVAEWIEIYAEERWPLPEPTAGREYSGRFVIRTTPENHRLLAVRALAAGQSLNTYCAERLAGAVAVENGSADRNAAAAAKMPRTAARRRRAASAAR
jgi:predicted HicB family RNase H-like nuclease